MTRMTGTTGVARMVGVTVVTGMTKNALGEVIIIMIMILMT